MTFLTETFRLGLTNLLMHKLRSLLTALGIIIGVGAVVAIAAYGEGTKQAALEQFKEQGANNIILRSVKPPASAENTDNEENGRSDDDEDEVEVTPFGLTRLDHRRLSTDSVGPIQDMVPLKRVGTFIYKDGHTTQNATVYGTTPRIKDAIPMSIARGRHLTESDSTQLKPVAVLGADAAQDLFRLTDPLGNEFSIDGQRFTVVGVLSPVGLTTGRDINFDVYIPMATARARFGDQRLLPGGTMAEQIELNELIIRVPQPQQVVPVAAQVRRVIEVGHKEDDVQVIVPLELIRQEERSRMQFTVLMIVIASLSLVVGGIGIMNIMLASVTERIREIGVRRALGATRRHIIAQFLVETMTLSLIGGVVGVLLGLSITILPFIVRAAARLIGSAPPEMVSPIPTLWSVTLGFTAAGLTGILAGLYPAIRAAWQDPIVALRHD